MNKIRLHILIAFILGVIIFLPSPGFTQPVDPPDPDIPIDAGVGFLIAAGAAFGVKKVHDFNKKKK